MMAPGDDSNREATFAEILSRYIDRLNAGESVDRLEIFTDHPEHAEALLAELGAFLSLDPAPEVDVNLGTLGDYTLRRQIGRGGMGVVYEAWQGSLDRRVALKVLPAGVAADSQAFLRFMKEAKTAAQLNHRNVVAVYGMGVEQNTPYFAMELVEGETLAQVLGKLKEADDNAMTPFGKKGELAFYSNIASAFADVADGLQHAHSRKIIHRDIKPSNLILDREGRLRILDFGLARLEGQESLTLSGDFLGTPQYMSPEQARRKRIPIDHRTDIYSLGATLYEMLTLVPAFRGRDHAETLSQIIERDPSPPSRINPRVPRDLETIVLKCLRKEAGDRFGTAEALGQDLRRFVRGEVIEARPQARWERIARRAWLLKAQVATVLVLLLLISTSGLLIYNYRLEVRAQNEAKARAAVMKLQAAKSLIGVGHALDILDLMPFHREPVESALRDLEDAGSALPAEPATHYHRATGLLLLQRDVEASEEVEKALGLDGGFVPARFARALIHEKLGEAGTLASESERVERSAASEWPKAWLRAHRLVDQMQWAEAAEAFGALVDIETSHETYLGSSSETILGRGLARLEAKQFERAIEDFRTAEVLWPGAFEPTLLKGKAYYLLGKKEWAEEEFESLFSRRDARGEALLWIWAVYNSCKNGTKALEWAERPKAGLPLEEQGVREFQRAWSLHTLGRWDESNQAASRAVELQPGSAIVQAGSGYIFAEHRRFADASRCLERAVAIDPAYAAGHVNLGYLFELQARYPEAVAACHEALKNNARYCPAYMRLAMVLTAMGNFDEAIRMGRKALEINPRSVLAKAILGVTLLRQGKIQEGMSLFLEAIDQDPENPSFHHHLGLWLYRQGRWKDAIAEWDKTTSLRSGFLWPYWNRALTLEKQGRIGDAFAEYAKAIEADPAFDWSHRNLAGILRRAGGQFAVGKTLDHLAGVLENSLKAGVDRPNLRHTLALARIHGEESKDIAKALDAIAAAVAKTQRKDPEILATLAEAEFLNGERARAVRTLEEALDLPGARQPFIEKLGEYRRALLPDLPTYASVDAALAALKGKPQALRELVDGFRNADGNPPTEEMLSYVEGRLLEDQERFHEAAEKFAAAARDRQSPQQMLALARCLRATRDPASARRVLRESIEKSSRDSGTLLDLWVVLGLVELKRTPAELAEELPGGGSFSMLREHLLDLQAGNPVRVRCGGDAYRARDGKVWDRDRFFHGGSTSFPNYDDPYQGEIQGTDDDPLYQRERWFARDEVGLHGYKIPLPPGRYRVALHFAEVWYTAPGLRRFDVRIEEAHVLTDYDPGAAGFATAEVKSFEVMVEDGFLDIEFAHKVDDPKISAIAVDRVN